MNDANRELGKFEEAFSPAQSFLPFFGTGDEARRRELPFYPGCSEEWKRSWIEADIRMGLEVCNPGTRPIQGQAEPWRWRSHGKPGTVKLSRPSHSFLEEVDGADLSHITHRFRLRGKYVNKVAGQSSTRSTQALVCLEQR